MGEWSSRVIPIVRGLCLLYVTHKYLGTTVVRISTRTGKLRPGDVVFFRSPENPRRVVCKRLVGMEGDQVTYVVDPKNSDKCNTIVVPKGHVWVEGDNIYNTKDSRNFGAVPYGLVEGKAFWTLLPRRDFGSLAPKPK
ncbi:hypothetical protein GOBAR_AA15903 [Gossypium barbadense]|uniref:Peptidase S26 domain-containing protein n=1 Tax=Gossypium barbadense TaxID=3634 RepID=A0A2P5XN46_GOSBA|nr:hypothetical protein GOBAR_AA15903 [Gossypium barbadense]